MNVFKALIPPIAVFYFLNDLVEPNFQNPYFLAVATSLIAFSVALIYRPVQGLRSFFISGPPLGAIMFVPLSYLLVVPFGAIVIFEALLAFYKIELYTLDVLIALFYLVVRRK